MNDKFTPEQWPIFDCLGRKITTNQAGGLDVVPQGRAFREGKWLPWARISATVYENRKLWPRDDYEIRITRAIGEPS